MIQLDEYMQYVRSNQIPPVPPIGTSPMGHGCPFSVDTYRMRDECTSRGLWTVIDQVWTKQLAEWIGQRSVLEIMAGAGWLAKALNNYGVTIQATDNFSWDARHSAMIRLFQVECYHALEAIATFDADILLISWPPYEDDAILAACRLWGGEKPIIYIGEGKGGCNAPGEFFKHFESINDHPVIDMMAWDGIHDTVRIGCYRS